MSRGRKEIILKICRVIAGLFIFSYGVHLTLSADIGVAPWDCLAQGIACRTPLNYGWAVTSVSIAVLVLDILLRQPIGYGIILDALLVGNMTQFFNDCCTFSGNLITGIPGLSGTPRIAAGCAMIAAGMIVKAVGQVIYIGAGLSCGPRDTLMVGLGKKFPRIPIGIVQNGILAMVLLTGWLLGGSLGAGTLFSVVFEGIAIQLVFRRFHFEPRDVQQQNLMETTAQLIRGNGKTD